MKLAHQDESAFHSVWKMVKFEEVRSVQDLVNPEKDVFNKSELLQDLALKMHVSKLPIIVELPENVKDDKDNEVENIMFAMMTYDVYKLIMLVKVEDEENVKKFVKNDVKNNEE